MEIGRIVLILTAECNMHCSYCYQTAKKALRMTRATLSASLDLALTSTSPEIELSFVGGEPLLEWSMISEAVSYVSKKMMPGKRLDFAISTNGLLMTEEIAAFLDEHKFKVQLSFDGIEPAQDHRGRKSFQDLNDLLDRLRVNNSDLFKSRLRVSTVQIPSTVPYFADSIRYLVQKGVREIGISPSLTPSPGWKHGVIDELDSQFGRIYEESLRHFKQTGEVPLEIFRKTKNQSERTETTSIRCSAETGETIVVDTDGQVYACVLFAESYQEVASEMFRSFAGPLRMGDLGDAEFHSRRAAYEGAVKNAGLFRGKEKRHSSYGRCAECPYLDDCWVCPVSIAYDPASKDPNRIPDFICAFNQVALKYRRQFPYMANPLEKLNSTLKRLASEGSAAVFSSTYDGNEPVPLG